MYLSSYIKKYKPENDILIIDSILEKLDYEAIADKILRFGADVVGISCWTFSLIDTLETAKVVKSRLPEAKIVVGGPHVNIYPKQTLENTCIDYVITNDGEKPFLALLESIKTNSGFDKVPNLYFKDSAGLHKSIIDHNEEKLDILPFPDRKATSYGSYYNVINAAKSFTTIITSRGCPFNCHFCLKQETGWRSRSVENIIEELSECVKLGIKEIYFFDETFTVNKKRITELCNEIKRLKLNISWSCRSRVDTIDEELILSLKSAGCKMISLGVESASPQVLKNLNKMINIEQALKVFKLLKKHKMASLADFMIACPGERQEDTKMTIELACKMDPDFVQFSMFTLLPCTKLYDDALKSKIIQNDTWRQFAQGPVIGFKPPMWNIYSEQEAVKLLDKAYRAFYLRPSYILRKIYAIKSFKQILLYIRSGLSIMFTMFSKDKEIK
jgi:radical SAM superfamily enzyme YgiQ (UPF0313 family)